MHDDYDENEGENRQNCIMLVEEKKEEEGGGGRRRRREEGGGAGGGSRVYMSEDGKVLLLSAHTCHSHFYSITQTFHYIKKTLVKL